VGRLRGQATRNRTLFNVFPVKPGQPNNDTREYQFIEIPKQELSFVQFLNRRDAEKK